LAQPQTTEGSKYSYAQQFSHLDWHSLSHRSGQDAIQLFFLRCLHSERSCHRFLLFPMIIMPCPLLQEMPLLLVLLLYIIISLEIEGAGVSIQAHSLPGPSFVHVWSFVCLSFLASPVTPHLRFLGQARVGCETSQRDMKCIQQNNSRKFPKS
jgi:hypothetical protein